jgi:hypothetical protein
MVWLEKFVATLLWESVRMKLTFSKWGLGSSPGLRKLQSSIAGDKTPCIGVFFISLESYRSVDVENKLNKLWQKEGLGVKLLIWLPTTKSWESTWPWCMQVECNTPLKRSQGELQVCFKSHPNQRPEHRVMTSQSPKSLNVATLALARDQGKGVARLRAYK